ncbi:ADP-ribose pyrophosphatase YjhB (NUDIX family) [Allocatelliglobosispora scoriae]|uniref:ADP-ribose pyrophosphatase YjhB (NUDIX family) n=1 Tax=Allocatelliglobosispora scoriae TaxID=643052 RepID=A0A841BKZ0_9ACTN|nr:NUDIX hydrolase [Allocatelliglobosispora scoriae]MBB5868954.1 ADP-ribose pyrophosphatase YjhB (NUDIX family) [Allocatelliglobosispora scoriae]
MTAPYRHSVSVTGVVVDGDGRVLVVQRRDNGRWELPGGILELDESIEDGMRREVLEETGVEVEPVRLSGVYKNIRIGVVALVFRARQIGGEPTTTDESQQVAWWTPAQITAAIAEPIAIRALDALQPAGTPIRLHDGVHLLDS